MINKKEFTKEAKQQMLKIQEENTRQHDKKCKLTHKYNNEYLVAIHSP